MEIRREAVGALATIGSPFARAALEKVAGRRLWFWQRREKRLQALAVRALATGRGMGADEDDDV